MIPASRCVQLNSTAEAMNAAHKKRESTYRANFDFLKSHSNCWKTTLGTGRDMEITETHCQMLGFVSGRVTVALTCNPDSWDAPHENEDVSIEKPFVTESNQ